MDSNPFPPPAAAPPRPITFTRRRRRKIPTWGWVAIGVAVVGGGVGVNALAGAKHESNAPSLTATEAACKMLREGDSPDRVYDVLRDLMDDDSYSVPNEDLAARVAINRARAQGC
jgi:hypothetical protein